MKVSNIIISSESYIFRQGLIAILNNVTGSAIIREAGHFDQLISQIHDSIKSIVFIDEDLLSHEQCVELLETSREYPKLKLIVFTNLPGNYCFQEYEFTSISKTIDKTKLNERLKELIVPNLMEGSQNGMLSDRELAVLKKVALGLTNKEISEQLFISPHTVITHRKNITAKLGIKTISGLTVYALLNNLITPDDLNKVDS